MINSFSDLDVWKLSDQVFMMLYKDSRKFPKDKTSEFIINQSLRSISSISANIAEGSGRGSKKDFVRFLKISRGSLTESQNWIIKIHQLKWINKQRFQEYMEKLSRIRKMLNVLIGKLTR